jgi:hypothetical protein
MISQAQNLQIELKQDQVQASFKSNEKKNSIFIKLVSEKPMLINRRVESSNLLHSNMGGFLAKKTNSNSKIRNSFTSKCTSLMKQQHARLCIIRLCATMLLRSYTDHDDY